jgi:hypothetical protein
MKAPTTVKFSAEYSVHNALRFEEKSICISAATSWRRKGQNIGVKSPRMRISSVQAIFSTTCQFSDFRLFLTKFHILCLALLLVIVFKQEEDHIGEIDTMHGDGEESIPSAKKGKKKRDSSTFRKAPQAPKRFKSSYICFFMAKQPVIKAELGENANVTSISKRSAEMWKHLSPEERAHWDDVAAKDKQRYMNEKASYTGPWQVPWKRVKKDPSGKSLVSAARLQSWTGYEQHCC